MIPKQTSSARVPETNVVEEPNEGIKFHFPFSTFFRGITSKLALWRELC